MRSQLSRWFAVAAVIVIFAVVAEILLGDAIYRSEREALHERERIMRLEFATQRAAAQSLELARAMTEVDRAPYRRALANHAASFQAAGSVVFEPESFFSAWIYARFADISPAEAYYQLNKHLRTLSRASAALSEAQTSLDIVFALSGVKAQVDADLLVDLQRLEEWHSDAMGGAHEMAEWVTAAIIPLLVATLLAVWFGMLRPLERSRREAHTALERSLEEARELAVRAESANRAKSNFLATMSHENLTPLNGVMGYAELIRATTGEAKVSDLALGVKRAGALLNKVLTDLLDLVKLEVGRMDLAPVAFDPNTLLSRIEAEYRAAADTGGVTLEIAPLEGAEYRIGDAELVLRALAHLVDNALKFAEGGVVRLQLTVDEESLVFTVTDDGPGMQADADALTRPFTQANQGETRSHTGTGLGLSIARGVAELMDGQLEIDGAPDAGATVRLRLRLRVANQIETAAAIVAAKRREQARQANLPAPSLAAS